MKTYLILQQEDDVTVPPLQTGLSYQGTTEKNAEAYSARGSGQTRPHGSKEKSEGESKAPGL